MPALLSASRRNRSDMALGGISTLEYMSARLVKKVNMLCVGLRKLNCAFVCSRLVRPVRKLRPLRATNWAVSLMTSRSKAVMPSGSCSVYCSYSACTQLHDAEAPASSACPHLVGRLQDDGLEVGGQLHRHFAPRRLCIAWLCRLQAVSALALAVSQRVTHLDSRLHSRLLRSEGRHLCLR